MIYVIPTTAIADAQWAIQRAIRDRWQLYLQMSPNCRDLCDPAKFIDSMADAYLELERHFESKLH